MDTGVVGAVQSLNERASAAVAHFSNRLRFETDASDVHAALESGTPGFVLVDTRSQAAWDQGHLPGALHLPTAQIATRARELVPAGTPVVTYCWGATGPPRGRWSSRGWATRCGRCWAGSSIGYARASPSRPGPAG